MTLAGIYMAVSLLSLIIQSVGFRRMQRQVGPATPPLVRRGMLRTAACRVAAAVLYVTLGVAALVQGDSVTPVLALLIFTATQVLWQANAVADVRLRRRLDSPPVGRHRSTRRRAWRL